MRRGHEQDSSVGRSGSGVSRHIRGGRSREDRDREVPGGGQSHGGLSRLSGGKVFYSGAVHAFTNPDAGNDPSRGAAYNAKADRRSWELMKSFFRELFGPIE